MEISFFFKNMLPKEEQELKTYLGIKIPKIERMLSHLPEDGAMLHIKGEKFEKHSAYEVELVVSKFSKRFVSKEDSHFITKAVDLAVDRLIDQLKRDAGVHLKRTHCAVSRKRTVSPRIKVLQ